MMNEDEMPLNEQEVIDLRRLRKTFDDVAIKYSGNDASYHSPHAVSEFCHNFYHSAFETEMQSVVEDIKRAIDKGEAAIQDFEINAAGDVVMSAMHAEHVFRQALEMTLLIGVEYGRRGYKPLECKCVQKLADTVEQELHKGNWDHL